ncbi:hypothetical protein BP5796_09381 [Coleophoma crateriformis]|uniref:Zn(2)-C6 fungal-type domain-containing protein n=1 Tax=Coleophoma crateriformis TaxID=565419 RepID=A0A3D8QXV6_9HELO|nr:hypothetical protein BP5796_09381 [Coleophoma crateriformis]
MAARRQFSSCDQCRRSKRKCIFLPAAPNNLGQSCLNCTYIDRSCTFEFVNARLEQRKQKVTEAAARSLPRNKRNQNSGRSRSRIHIGSTAEEPQSPRLDAAFASASDSLGDLGEEWNSFMPELDSPANFSTAVPGVLAADKVLIPAKFGPNQPALSLSNDQNNSLLPYQSGSRSNAGDTPSSALGLAVATDFGSFDEPEEEWSTYLMPDLITSSGSYNRQIYNPTKDYIPGHWKGSPIQLLNSTATRSLLGDRLYDMYRTMMSGIETRYLTYTCNSYSPINKYYFLEGEEEEIAPDSVSKSPPLLSNHSINRSGVKQTVEMTPEMSPSREYIDLSRLSKGSEKEDEARKVTFVGLAQFLDHFGHLYGNRLDKQTKKEDEEVLVAVQRAFALQWSTCDDLGATTYKHNHQQQRSGETEASVSNARIFATAWFNARSQISNTKPHHSFARIYTILLFHTMHAPAEAENLTQESDEILRQGLEEFLTLRNLVEEYYSKHLSSTSIYRMLLESSVKIFHWFAYIRDTMASMVSDRACVLQNIPIGSGLHPASLSPLATRWTHTPLNQVDIPNVCRQTVSHTILLFRQFLHLRDVLKSGNIMSDGFGIIDLVVEATATVDEVNSIYGQFYEKCTSEFDKLSRPAKSSSGFLILFWNLGVLSLVEQIQTANSLGFISRDCEAFSKACQYQKAALKSIITISSNMTTLHAHGPCHIELSRGLNTKLPLISDHANLLLTVTTLVKAIETTIHINTSNDNIGEDAIASRTEFGPVESWMSLIKPLLSCLLDLDVTVAGSNTARVAFQKLMTSHSDILMDGWAVEKDDVRFGGV